MVTTITAIATVQYEGPDIEVDTLLVSLVILASLAGSLH